VGVARAGGVARDSPPPVDAEPPHGPEFVATFCELAEVVMGPEVAHVLRVVYAKEGVR
jgi:hypothetical protein